MTRSFNIFFKKTKDFITFFYYMFGLTTSFVFLTKENIQASGDFIYYRFIKVPKSYDRHVKTHSKN